MTSHLFLAAFGGPTKGCCKRFDPCPGEATCFVSGVFGHNEARKARIEEVAAHYKHLGGFSRFNEITERQAQALKSELARRGKALGVTCGYYHWNPYIMDQVAGMAQSGVKDFIALVMAPHQSSVSWDGYLRRIQEGLEALPENARPAWKGVVDPWWTKPGFITALAERIKAAAATIGAELTAPDAGVLFSTHAIPMAVARTSPYVRQTEETVRAVVEALGLKRFKLGFQSQPTDSRIEWTKPSMEDALAELAKDGARKVVGCAVGFLCDNVEVLYDMGVEGRQEAAKLGVQFAAAEAVNDHPSFISMLADQVEAKLASLK
jgi:ferrochelatase